MIHSQSSMSPGEGGSADVRRRVLGLIQAQLQDQGVRLDFDTPVHAIRMDSIDVINVLFSIEEEFGAHVELSSEIAYDTVGAFVDSLVAFIPGRQPRSPKDRLE